MKTKKISLILAAIISISGVVCKKVDLDSDRNKYSYAYGYIIGSRMNKDSIEIDDIDMDLYREELNVPVMINMRRYLKENEPFQALANLTSTVETKLDYHSGEDFKGTLSRVKKVMDQKKGSNIGLNGFFKLNLLFRILPNKKAESLLRLGFKNPLICMTNIGILDYDRISFSGNHPVDAFMCGSIKYKPHFQLAASTYKNELTLSSNLYGTPDDRKQILSFLDDVCRELSDALCF